MENALKNSVSMFALGSALIVGSSCGSLCRAHDKNGLPDAPAPMTTKVNCPKADTDLLCLNKPQQSSAPRPAGASSTPVWAPGGEKHRFWDRENVVLFSFVGASRALDYSSTLNMRRRGRQEILLTNDIVDNHAGFAAIEAGGTAVSIGASYLFHRYQHHRLERWTSIIHGSLTTTGAIRNYCLKTAHPQ